MRTLTENAPAIVDPGEHLLLACPPFVADGSGACADLLTLESAAERNVLSIAYTHSFRDRLTICEEHTDTRPAEATIVDVDADTRSAPPSASDHALTETHPELTRERVSSPTDLTSLGVTVTNQLDAWEEESPDRQVVGCFHSITSLVQYVGLEQAFKFLNVLTSRFSRSDAITHFHVDPSAHDEQAISQLSTPFDAVVEYDKGEWTTRAR